MVCTIINQLSYQQEGDTYEILFEVENVKRIHYVQVSTESDKMTTETCDPTEETVCPFVKFFLEALGSRLLNGHSVSWSYSRGPEIFNNNQRHRGWDGQPVGQSEPMSEVTRRWTGRGTDRHHDTGDGQSVVQSQRRVRRAQGPGKRQIMREIGNQTGRLTETVSDRERQGSWQWQRSWDPRTEYTQTKRPRKQFKHVTELKTQIANIGNTKSTVNTKAHFFQPICNILIYRYMYVYIYIYIYIWPSLHFSISKLLLVLTHTCRRIGLFLEKKKTSTNRLSKTCLLKSDTSWTLSTLIT